MTENNKKILKHLAINDLYRIIEILLHMYIVYKKSTEYYSLVTDILYNYVNEDEDFINKILDNHINEDEFKYVLDPSNDLIEDIKSPQDIVCAEIIKDLLKNNHVEFDLTDIEK